jgi:molybdopterin-guanine dinucleotide biosynthesis protein A
MPRLQRRKAFSRGYFTDGLNLSLDNGGRKVQDWSQLHACSFVEFLYPPYDTCSFANINTESERLALEQYLPT